MVRKIMISSLILVALAAAGCGKVDREIAKLTGASELCLNGVTYYQFTSGAAVAYNRDGSVKPCN